MLYEKVESGENIAKLPDFHPATLNIYVIYSCRNAEQKGSRERTNTNAQYTDLCISTFY